MAGSQRISEWMKEPRAKGRIEKRAFSDIFPRKEWVDADDDLYLGTFFPLLSLMMALCIFFNILFYLLIFFLNPKILDRINRTEPIEDLSLVCLQSFPASIPPQEKLIFLSNLIDQSHPFLERENPKKNKLQRPSATRLTRVTKIFDFPVILYDFHGFVC